MDFRPRMMMMMGLFGMCFWVGDAAKNASFDENYFVIWGNHHVTFLNQGREVQLLMDNTSGAGFGSKAYFGSGFFNMRIKLPGNDSSSVVTAFYLTSNTSNQNQHDEVDFEFLGNKESKRITLQTNVFSNGLGGREQRTLLWFDPTVDFHSYKILWNQQQIAFFVDDIPIRVFKNNTNIKVPYPSKPMQVVVSLWDGSGWATDGGLTKTNWTSGPFKAHFEEFNIDGCPSSIKDCSSSRYWWNTQKYWTLDPNQQKAYEGVKKYINYDYCADRGRYPTPPPECPK